MKESVIQFVYLLSTQASHLVAIAIFFVLDHLMITRFHYYFRQCGVLDLSPFPVLHSSTGRLTSLTWVTPEAVAAAGNSTIHSNMLVTHIPSYHPHIPFLGHLATLELGLGFIAK